MYANERVQLSVETPRDQVRLIRVTGTLDRAAAATLLRLIDAQMALVAARRSRITGLLVDLDGVSSYEPGGLEVMRHARRGTTALGIGLYLTGCSAKFCLLPLRARQLIATFDTFPTVEAGLAALTRDGVPVPVPVEPPTHTITTPSTAQVLDGPGDLGVPNGSARRSSPSAAGLPAPREAAEPGRRSGSESAPHPHSDRMARPPR